ncbi:hypothetical protein A4X03_0g9032, partial [Tilletia caries]
AIADFPPPAVADDLRGQLGVALFAGAGLADQDAGDHQRQQDERGHHHAAKQHQIAAGSFAQTGPGAHASPQSDTGEQHDH